MYAEAIAQVRAQLLSDLAVYQRHAQVAERTPQQIGLQAIRGGDIVGDHTVMYCGTGERVEITHKAGSRMPYALGSLRAARFLSGKPNGLFDMQDVLGLR